MKKIHKNQYALCIPLSFSDQPSMKTQTENLSLYHPDFIEWRRDYYTDTHPENEKECLRHIRETFPHAGLIYTFRSQSEGGVGTWSLTKRQESICRCLEGNLADYIDTEASNSEPFLNTIKDVCRTSKANLILSYHNFKATPSPMAIIQKLTAIESLNPDVIKIALMAQTPDDIRRSICAVSQYSETTNKPIIFIAMGPYGCIVRSAPELFGGSLSFATAGESTAPGQLTPKRIENIRRSLFLLPTRPHNIALIGYMGTGKTTVGKFLAQQTGMTFVDTDGYIEEMTGKTIPQIFSESGEKAFRDLETRALKAILQKNDQIIATGGGTVLREENRSALIHHTFPVTLTADSTIIARRVSRHDNRPLLSDHHDLIPRIEAMLDERHAFYQIGLITIDTSASSVASCVEQIINAF